MPREYQNLCTVTRSRRRRATSSGAVGNVSRAKGTGDPPSHPRAASGEDLGAGPETQHGPLPSEPRHRSPRWVLGAVGDEVERGWDAVAWEAHRHLVPLQRSLRVSIGIAIGAIPGLEHEANLPGSGVKARRRGSGEASRSGVRILTRPPRGATRVPEPPHGDPIPLQEGSVNGDAGARAQGEGHRRRALLLLAWRLFGPASTWPVNHSRATSLYRSSVVTFNAVRTDRPTSCLERSSTNGHPRSP